MCVLYFITSWSSCIWRELLSNFVRNMNIWEWLLHLSQISRFLHHLFVRTETIILNLIIILFFDRKSHWLMETYVHVSVQRGWVSVDVDAHLMTDRHHVYCVRWRGMHPLSYLLVYYDLFINYKPKWLLQSVIDISYEPHSVILLQPF